MSEGVKVYSQKSGVVELLGGSCSYSVKGDS